MGPVERWRALLDHDAARQACPALAERMRERRLTFGGRLLCPFLRPFFLAPDDEDRVREAAELLWTLGERVAREAPRRPALLAALGLTEAEIRLAGIDPGYQTASTAARADAFLLPGSLRFAEYNAESPAGPGYAHRLGELFAEEPLMARFREAFDARMHRTIDLLLDALVASYREWGGTASPPLVAIVDWRDVPTWSEFELLRDAFVSLGVPTVVADPRELSFEGGGLVAAGRRVDLVYRRVLVNDIVQREKDCRALLAAYERQAVCVANTLRCKIPHKKAFFAVLTDDRYADLFSPAERESVRRHVPWTRLLRDGDTVMNGQRIDLVSHLRRHREEFVIKPNDEYGGSGVTLGWETGADDWDVAIGRALAQPERAWIAQERIPVRREAFPMCEGDAVVEREMLVDFAPYLFRGRLSGFLTRLSATGLANVTSGGGQVPAFVVVER